MTLNGVTTAEARHLCDIRASCLASFWPPMYGRPLHFAQVIFSFFRTLQFQRSSHVTKLYTVSGKIRPKCFFLISPTILGRCWWNMVHLFLNKFAAKSRKRFHLTWIMYPHYLFWNLKCSSWACYHRVVIDRNSRIYPTSSVAYKFTRCESVGICYVK